MGIKFYRSSPRQDCFAGDTAPQLLAPLGRSTRDSLDIRHRASKQVSKFLRSSWGSRDLEIHGRGGREQLSPERTTPHSREERLSDRPPSPAPNPQISSFYQELTAEGQTGPCDGKDTDTL